MSVGVAAALAVANAQASMAVGAIVHVEPSDFLAILERQPGSLVVRARSGVFSITHRYLTSYKGLVFFTKSPVAIDLPPATQIVQSKRLWVPGE